MVVVEQVGHNEIGAGTYGSRPGLPPPHGQGHASQWRRRCRRRHRGSARAADEMSSVGSGFELREVGVSDDVTVGVSDAELVDAYVCVLGRFLVIRQEHLDLAEESVDRKSVV